MLVFFYESVIILKSVLKVSSIDYSGIKLAPDSK
jgi:hypothetical protein